MAATAQELKEEIEERRRAVDDDLEAIGDKVSPSKVARRRADAVGSKLSSAKTAVMGSAGDAAGSVRSGATAIPGQISSTAQGNPLAAGLVAFGLGLVVAAALPASDAERRAAASVDPLLDDLAHTAVEQGRTAAAELEAPLQEAVHDVADAATRGATAVKDTATGATPS